MNPELGKVYAWAHVFVGLVQCGLIGWWGWQQKIDGMRARESNRKFDLRHPEWAVEDHAQESAAQLKKRLDARAQAFVEQGKRLERVGLGILALIAKSGAERGAHGTQAKHHPKENR